MGLAWAATCFHQAWALLIPLGQSGIRRFKLSDGFLQVCTTFKTYVFWCVCFSSRCWWRLRSLGQYAVSLAWSVICVHQAWALLIPLGHSGIRRFKLSDGFLQVCTTFKTYVFWCVCFSSRCWWRLRSLGQYAVSLAWSVICVHQAWALLIPLGHSGIRRFKLSDGFLQVCTTFKTSVFWCVCFSSRPWWRLRSLGQYAVRLAWAAMCFHQTWALFFPLGHIGIRRFEFCNDFLQVCATFKASIFRCVCFFSRHRCKFKCLDWYAVSLAGLVMFFYQAWSLLLPCDNTGVRGFEFCNGFLKVCATFRTSVFRCSCFFCRRHLWRHRSLG